MKKVLYISVCCLLLLLSSCTQEDSTVDNQAGIINKEVEKVQIKKAKQDLIEKTKQEEKAKAEAKKQEEEEQSQTGELQNTTEIITEGSDTLEIE